MMNTDKAVIRNDTGKLVIHQCKPKLRYQKAMSQHIIASNDKTPNDILNKLKFNNTLRSIVMGSK